MNEYQASALMQGIAFILVLAIVSLVLFISSQNKTLGQRLLVSAYPVVFVFGEIYALIASSYYERGSWDNGVYIPTESGAILEGILFSIFALGLALAGYSWFKYQGDKMRKLLVIPATLVAVVLFFVAAMTLTRDWI